MENYLKPTYYIDCGNEDIITFALAHSSKEKTDIENAISLYYAVRDQIRYDPYNIEPSKENMIASNVLKRGYGFCVAKAVLLAACARAVHIPARLGFADVKNHLNTKKLQELMTSDLFVYHGFTELFLNKQWVKATPAFNLELCINFNVKPLEFDGTKDSIFHPFDNSGKKHMEYVRDHGSFDDLPWDMLIVEYQKAYPVYFETLARRSGNFAKEALRENMA